MLASNVSSEVSKVRNEEYTRKPLKIVDGIPYFIERGFFYREIPYYDTLNISYMSKKCGWRFIVQNYEDPLFKKTLLDPSRLLFLSFLKIPKKSRILDLGAGWGFISLKIAKGYPDSLVYAYDATFESLLFLSSVIEQERITNLKVVCGDAMDLPFPDNYFDTLIMIGVLEWIPEFHLEDKPEKVQIKCLNEVNRVLKKNGSLLLASENRYGYPYILGEKDHCGLSYTSLMPRFIADLYCKFRINKKYRTFTHSRKKYIELLRKAGFSNIIVYGCAKHYGTPYAIFSPEMFKEVLQQTGWRSLKRKIARVLPNKLLSVSIPSFIILGRK